MRRGGPNVWRRRARWRLGGCWSAEGRSGVVKATGGAGAAARIARSSARGVPRSKGSAGWVSLAGGGERGAGLCFLGAAGCCAAGVDMLAG